MHGFATNICRTWRTQTLYQALHNIKMLAQCHSRVHSFSTSEEQGYSLQELVIRKGQFFQAQGFFYNFFVSVCQNDVFVLLCLIFLIILKNISQVIIETSHMHLYIQNSPNKHPMWGSTHAYTTHLYNPIQSNQIHTI